MNTYSIETVLKGVGSIRASDRLAVRQALGHGVSIIHNHVDHELHLGWRLDADTVDEAIDAARIMHAAARRATGVYDPRTTFFSVREVNEN